MRNSFLIVSALAFPIANGMAADACQPIADAVVAQLGYSSAKPSAAVKTTTKAGAELDAVRDHVATQNKTIDESGLFSVKDRADVKDYADSNFSEGAAGVRAPLLKAVGAFLPSADKLSTRELYAAVAVVQENLRKDNDVVPNWLAKVGYLEHRDPTIKINSLKSLEIPIKTPTPATKNFAAHVVDQVSSDRGLEWMVFTNRGKDGTLYVDATSIIFERKGDECRIKDFLYRGMAFDDPLDYHAELSAAACTAAAATKPLAPTTDRDAILKFAKKFLVNEGAGVDQLYGPTSRDPVPGMITSLNAQLRMRKGACAKFAKFLSYPSEKKSTGGAVKKTGAGAKDTRSGY